MTTFRDDDDSAFQTHIDGLSHSSISTKLSAIEALETQLQTEQTALETQRAQLHKHKQKVADLTKDLTSICGAMLVLRLSENVKFLTK